MDNVPVPFGLNENEDSYLESVGQPFNPSFFVVSPKFLSEYAQVPRNLASGPFLCFAEYPLVPVDDSLPSRARVSQEASMATNRTRKIIRMQGFFISTSFENQRITCSLWWQEFYLSDLLLGRGQPIRLYGRLGLSGMGFPCVGFKRVVE